MLIPISVYIVLAVSLNLVGWPAWASCRSATRGFLSVGLFSGCLVAIALCCHIAADGRAPAASR